MWTWVLALPATLCFALVVVNALSWTRGGRPSKPGRSPLAVSVLIPARNEEANIDECIGSALQSTPSPLEVLVYDDESTDSTPARLRRWMAEDVRVATVPQQALPAGWVGKPHACQRLGAHAHGDVLLFLDADVRLAPEGLGRLLALLEDAELVTAVPRQEYGGFFERLIVPLLHLTYTAWLPLWLVPRTRDPRVLAANGQILAMRRETFDALGGFAAVRDAIVDDMALCRRAKGLGHRVVFADGHHLGSCRMYRSARAVWEGFSKNLYLGIGATPGRLTAVLALYVAAFVAPFGALGVASPDSIWWEPALAGVIANLGLRAVLAVRHQQPASGILLQPLAVLALLAIALNSYRWSRTKQVRWAGRTYEEAGA